MIPVYKINLPETENLYFLSKRHAELWCEKAERNPACISEDSFNEQAYENYVQQGKISIYQEETIEIVLKLKDPRTYEPEDPVFAEDWMGILPQMIRAMETGTFRGMAEARVIRNWNDEVVMWEEL